MLPISAIHSKMLIPKSLIDLKTSKTSVQKVGQNTHKSAQNIANINKIMINVRIYISHDRLHINVWFSINECLKMIHDFDSQVPSFHSNLFTPPFVPPRIRIQLDMIFGIKNLHPDETDLKLFPTTIL